jgi:hypothetical protein
MCENIQHANKHTCNITLKKDETFGTDAYNIRVQPLQHVQHPDLFLKHSYETLAHISETLKHLKNTPTTRAFSATFPCCLGEWRLVGM